MALLLILSTLGILAIVGADQLTKLWAVNTLKPVGSMDFIPGFMRFSYVENKGAAFGMLSNQRWIFIVITVVMVLAAMFLLYSGKLRKPLRYLPAICIIGGGIGNLIDRIGKGYVVDMFDFQFMKFAVFNVADAFVCIGAALIVLCLIVEDIQARKIKWNNNLISIRNIVPCIVVSLVTLGGYGIYWVYKLMKNIKTMENDKSECYKEMLCLVFVPFYSYYWWVTRGKKVKSIFDACKINTTGNETLYLILAIFGLEFVSMAIMQSDFNSLEDASAKFEENKNDLDNESIIVPIESNDETDGQQ